MERSLVDDLDRLLCGLAKAFAQEGKAREVALLVHSQAKIEQNGGTYGYTIYLEAPAHLYAQVAGSRELLEKALQAGVNDLTRMYDNEFIREVMIVPKLPEDNQWREKAKAWLRGQGVTNQGRARSDNVAPLICDGLHFRSQQEIHLYRALRALGITFAPLAVFVRGGQTQTYRRIEPDFVLVKDGILMIVEVDGDTVHDESPREAHDRLTMLHHEGAYVERVNAKDCQTSEAAKQCAAKILAVIEKLRSNK